MTDALQNGELNPAARAQIADHLAEMRTNGGGDAFAVRSSALSEDSAAASFAGEFESVLDVSTDEEIWAWESGVQRDAL